MKFAVVVVLFALALGAHSSIVPISVVPGSVLVSQPGSVSVQAAVRTIEVPQAIQLIQGSPLQTIVAGPVPAAVQVVASPAVVPTVVAVAPAEGTYVAKTRGAVHVAPLPGHSNSASSVNLEPAPGTV